MTRSILAALFVLLTTDAGACDAACWKARDPAMEDEDPRRPFDINFNELRKEAWECRRNSNFSPQCWQHNNGGPSRDRLQDLEDRIQQLENERTSQ